MPSRAWDAIARPGVETVWLMGVWERSPFGREVAFADPGMRAATAATLRDATDDDVVGSPYCIFGYTVDPHLGGREGLAAARDELAQRGLRLLLDFVPNHVAPDHEWVADHPEYFVLGSEDEIARDPQAWLRTAGGIYARGRDPYFPPWPDVVQLDPMSAGMRDAVVATLDDVAEQCDGVRCDMAMLALDDVAQRTWPGRLQSVRPEPYWREVTSRVRQMHPDFVFVAEAYWDLESRLLEEGIDHCYDKRLYDRLVAGDAAGIRAHLGADPGWQSRLVRFLENHDEPRAAAELPPERLRAATLALLTLPGWTLLHDGQLDGLRTRLPVHLGRRPAEEPDPAVRSLWSRLLPIVEHVRTGEWRLLGVHGWPDNESWGSLLAWRWSEHVVVINYGGGHAEGLVELNMEPSLLHDLLDDEAYWYAGGELYVALHPYQAHLFRVT